MRLQKKYGFTLSELLVSTAISTVIIWGISILSLNMISSFYNGKSLLNIYSDTNDFLIDTYQIQYQSGKYLTGAQNNHLLFLYDTDYNGLILGWVTKNAEYFHVNARSNISKSYLWIISTNPTTSSGILNGSIDYKTFKSLQWKIYTWCPIYENNINTLSGGTIFEMTVSCLKSIPNTPNNIPKDSIEKIILNF